MTIAILILAYIFLVAEIRDMIIEDKSNYLLISALVVLLSWQQNMIWGIVMLAASVIVLLIVIFGSKK